MRPRTVLAVQERADFPAWHVPQGHAQYVLALLVGDGPRHRPAVGAERNAPNTASLPFHRVLEEHLACVSAQQHHPFPACERQHATGCHAPALFRSRHRRRGGLSLGERCLPFGDLGCQARLTVLVARDLPQVLPPVSSLASGAHSVPAVQCLFGPGSGAANPNDLSHIWLSKKQGDRRWAAPSSRAEPCPQVSESTPSWPPPCSRGRPSFVPIPSEATENSREKKNQRLQQRKVDFEKSTLSMSAEV